jgi:sulfur carrier protein ThiS
MIFSQDTQAKAWAKGAVANLIASVGAEWPPAAIAINGVISQQQREAFRNEWQEIYGCRQTDGMAVVISEVEKQ